MQTLVLIVAATVLGVYAWIWFRRHDRPVLRSFGITFDRWLPADLGVGVLIPFLAITLVFLVEWGLGAIEVTGSDASIGDVVVPIPSIAFFALIEEVLFRVLLLTGLIVALRKVTGGRWIAVLATAAVFGASHLGNENATAIGAFGTGLGGLMYGIAFVASRGLWLPLALHTSWNLSQALWGFPVSGNDEWSGWVTSTSVGDDLLTGGDYGPEGGIPGMISRFLIIGLVLAYVKWRWPQGRFSTLTYAPDPVKREPVAASTA